MESPAARPCAGPLPSAIARQRFETGTPILYKYNNNKPAVRVEGKSVKGVGLSVISYLSTRGKYQVEKNQLFEWFLVPDEADEAFDHGYSRSYIGHCFVKDSEGS